MTEDQTVKDPSSSVQRAALVLSQEDSTDATCYGWVPQARRALAAALTVQEVLPHIPAPKVSEYVRDWPQDEQDMYRNPGWLSFTERGEAMDIYRRQKAALAIITALVGAP